MGFFFFKVLRLLEDVGLPDLVIQLATLAVSEAVNDQRSQVQKLCTLFTLQLPTFMIFVLTFMLLFIFVTQTHTGSSVDTYF